MCWVNDGFAGSASRPCETATSNATSYSVTRFLISGREVRRADDRPTPARPSPPGRRAAITTAVTGPSDGVVVPAVAVGESLDRPARIGLRRDGVGDAVAAAHDQPACRVGADVAEDDRRVHERAGIEADRRRGDPGHWRGPGSMMRTRVGGVVAGRAVAASAAAAWRSSARPLSGSPDGPSRRSSRLTPGRPRWRTRSGRRRRVRTRRRGTAPPDA